MFGDSLIYLEFTDASNWMRFVRPATKYEEQNLVICQQNDGIVFLTVRDIVANEELRAGPHPDYARRRNLPILEPADKHAKGTLRLFYEN